MSSIAMTLEIFMHNRCKAEHPKLYSTIAALVAAGQTAKQIESELTRRNPTLSGTLTIDMVFYAATVLVAARAAAKRKSAA